MSSPGEEVGGGERWTKLRLAGVECSRRRKLGGVDTQCRRQQTTATSHCAPVCGVRKCTGSGRGSGGGGDEGVVNHRAVGIISW